MAAIRIPAGPYPPSGTADNQVVFRSSRGAPLCGPGCIARSRRTLSSTPVTACPADFARHGNGRSETKASHGGMGQHLDISRGGSPHRLKLGGGEALGKSKAVHTRGFGQARCFEPGDGRVPLDRKSTRLNSSHSQISYAVFCLKK